MTHNGKYRQKRPLKSGLKESRAEVEEERVVPELPAEWLWPQNIASRLACPKGDALGARLSLSDKGKHTSFSGERRFFWFDVLNGNVWGRDSPRPSRATF